MHSLRELSSILRISKPENNVQAKHVVHKNNVFETNRSNQNFIRFAKNKLKSTICNSRNILATLTLISILKVM